MRKTAILIVILLVFNGLCFAQSTGNENRIIGSWQQVFTDSPETWVFNNNGMMTMAGTSTRYGITGTKIAIYMDGDTVIFDYSISTDGRTLIITVPNSNFGYCLTKR